MPDPAIHVLNLERSSERWRLSRDAFADAGFMATRLPAVDGSALSRGARLAAHDPAAPTDHFAPLSDSEIGCALSHRAAWRALLDSGAPMAAVFEDDVVPAAGFAEVFRALAADPAPAWHVAKLDARRNARGPAVADLPAGRRLYAPRPASLRAGAYLVTRAGAALLDAGVFPLRRPIDVELQFGFAFGLVLREARPRIVEWSAEAARSTIQGAGKPRGLARLVREARRTAFRLRLAALAEIAARKERAP